MNRFKVLLFIFIIIFFKNSLLLSVDKNILVLHSYHKGLSWTEEVIKGIESIFNEEIRNSYNIKIYYEYMDTKRFEDKEYLKLLIPVLKYKTNKVHYDLIIAVDDNALNFLIENRNSIFGEIPIVFCGINFLDEEKIRKINRITGVVEAFSAKDNIDLITKLHPHTKQIIIVGDNTYTSLLNNKVIQSVEKNYPQIKFIYLTNSNLPYYRRFLKALSEDSVVLAMLFNLDDKNKFYTYEESFKFYSSGLKIPIYTFWNFYLGLGSIGGKIINGFTQGEMAAKIAIRIIDGELPEKIPIIKESPNQYIFDYKKIQDFGIDIEKLPKESKFINTPVSLREFYDKYQIYINIIIGIMIFLMIIIAILIFNIKEKISAQKKLLATNLAYYRFVPKEFLEYLGKNEITEVKLGDAISKEFTVLFSDIRGFTSISEKMTPKENFQFINDYLKFISPAIRMYDGFIDKFIGDAIMALFPKAENALKSAIEMIHRLQDFNKYLQQKNVPNVSIGIGIHCGTLILGTLGEEYRMESTVISDVVNAASRLESLTKTYGTKMIISEEILKELKEKRNLFSFRYLGKVIVKGKTTPITIYEVLDAEDSINREEKIKNKEMFEKSVILYEKKQKEEAIKILEEIYKKNQNDKAAFYILKKIKDKDS